MEYVTLRVRLVQLRGEDRRDFNGGERKGRRGMSDIFIKYMFGSKVGRGDERDFN